MLKFYRTLFVHAYCDLMITAVVTIEYLRKLRLHVKLRLVIGKEKALLVGNNIIFVIIIHYICIVFFKTYILFYSILVVFQFRGNR